MHRKTNCNNECGQDSGCNKHPETTATEDGHNNHTRTNADEPMLTSDVTAAMSILDTAMVEEDELPRLRQVCVMQESVNKLLKGCRLEQDLQEKIAMLTSERDVAVNNAVVNLHQYENLQKENIKLAEEINRLKKIQGSGETTPIIQKLKQQIREKDDTITMQQQEINDTCAA